MFPTNDSSEFISYLTSRSGDLDDNGRLPTINTLSEELGVSVTRLREQIEVAKALGFVEVRPRTGIRRLPYSFMPAVWQSLSFALSCDINNFDVFSNLRNQIEAIYWNQAVERLTSGDHERLKLLITTAFNKLNGKPILIPHLEHRELHLTIFHRLGNPFVLGILEAYWEAYVAVGLNVYTDYYYLKEVWDYHHQIVEAICCGDYDAGHQALIEHKDLIYHR